MQYDWSGGRTRRVRRLKITMWTALALVVVASPAAFAPIELEMLLPLVQ